MPSLKNGITIKTLRSHFSPQPVEGSPSQDRLLSNHYADSEKDELETTSCLECNKRTAGGSPPTSGRPQCFSLFFFALFNIAAVVLIWGAIRDLRDDNNPETFFPKLPLVPLTFQDPHLGDLPSPTSTAAWSSDLPPGNGFVYIEDPTRYNLPPGGKSSKNPANTYGVTWTHQYHCLQMLHTSIADAVTSNSTLVKAEDDRYVALHLFHCIDYLRQTVVCNMDTTIEWPTAMGHKHVSHINGYGIPHMCKPKEAVHKFMVDHAVP